ncbi:MAG: ABC transporter permease [Candidatus Azobacteroides sp.]|nr:ABC transporter permease [Candidatus Azobacteroides sp.]
MNSFALAFRTLSKRNRNNFIKILCLGSGLAVGLILISKVLFENTYDDFFPDKERIYQVQSNVVRENEQPNTYPQVSGAVAPGLKAEIPGIALATRFTYIGEDAVFYTADKNNYKGTFILADSCLFDVLPLPMIIGNAKEILSRPMYAVVSKKIAEMIGGDVIGKTLEIGYYPGREITIGGIFENIPENSHLHYDVILSMNSIGNFTWDGTQNWLGNDRYIAYVKLAPGVTPESLAPAVYEMQKKYQNIEELERKDGVKLTYSFAPLTGLHRDVPETKRMTILLSIIAFALICTTLMNYILIVISSLVERAKAISTYKCYGAREKDIAKIILSETLLHLILSLFLAAILIGCFRETVSEVLSASVSALLTFRTCAFLFIICLIILLIAGLVPTYLFSRIPVTTVFRNLKITRKGWKMTLLFIQLLATAFLVNLLIIVSRQYRIMVNDDPGYKYDQVLYCVTAGIEDQIRQTFIDNLDRMPEVDRVGTSSTLLFDRQSGNNVSLPDNKDKEFFNFADLYEADENYLPLLDVSVIDGKPFSKENVENDMLVSKKFADKISLMAGWQDGVVGKDLYISEHDLCKIVGVYPDLRIGSISNEDPRPSAMFYTDKPSFHILIKLHEMNPDNIRKVFNTLKTSIPDKEIALIPYKESMIKQYEGAHLFQKTITIGGIITLVITLIGLIGYTNNEVTRRRSEIAIRKVNGATLTDILKLFVKDNLWVSIPSLICGSLAATIAAGKWMENFSEKAELTFPVFIVSGLIILAVILSVVMLNCMYVAGQNPVKTLKNE